MAASFEKWIELGKQIGLEGQDLKDFLSEKQNEEREERNAEREMAKLRIQMEQEEKDRSERREKEERESCERREKEERESRERREREERHLARDCTMRNQVVSAMQPIQDTKAVQDNGNKDCERVAACFGGNPYNTASSECTCVGKTEIKLGCGKTMPVVTGVCQQLDKMKSMPVKVGYVGEHQVETLRDTGCSGVVVKKSLIKPEQLLEQTQKCMLIDGSIITVPTAKIYVNTPYFTGHTEAVCMEKPVYDLIIGNIAGARHPNNADPGWNNVMNFKEIYR